MSSSRVARSAIRDFTFPGSGDPCAFPTPDDSVHPFDPIPVRDPYSAFAMMPHSSRFARPLWILLLLLAAPPAVVRAQGGDADAPAAAPPAISAAARAYLLTALDTLQRASMHSASADWAVVRDSALLLAAGAQRPADTYGAIQWALRRVDRHSFLQARRSGVNPELVDGRFGYLRVPFYAGPSRAPLTDSLQHALRTLEAGGACGWVVDLRMNGGGNVWPMQAGIGPLVGDSVLTREVLDGRVVGSSLYVDGSAIEVAADGTRQEIVRVADPYRMRRADAPVAVLIDGATASSAEAVAIIFRPRPRTRFFGQPTAGVSTVNRGAQLPDGANMVITVGVMADRNGRAYGGAIAPDEVVPMPAGFWPSSADAVTRRATEWLARQPGCAAETRGAILP